MGGHGFQDYYDVPCVKCGGAIQLCRICQGPEEEQRKLPHECHVCVRKVHDAQALAADGQRYPLTHKPITEI